MSYYGRPTLQAARYNERRGNFNRNPYRNYNFQSSQGPKKGTKRHRDGDSSSDNNNKRHRQGESPKPAPLPKTAPTPKPAQTPNASKANERLNNLRKSLTPQKVDNVNDTDSKVPVSNSAKKNNSFSKISPGSKKNTASERLKTLRKSLENEKTESNKKSPPSTITKPSDRLKNIRVEADVIENVEMKELDNNFTGTNNNLGSSTSTYTGANQIEGSMNYGVACTNNNLGPSTSTFTGANQIQGSMNYGVEPSTSHYNPSLNAIESPVKLEEKVNKFAFTNEWIAQTNFDGNTSSFMELSTQARANDTVANMEAIQGDVVEMEWTSEINSIKMFSGQTGKSHDVCIVVDTNIFIDNLTKIRDIIRLKMAGATKPIIYVPWMVITELDYIKDTSRDPNLKRNAFNAVKYINELLNEKHPRLVGQTVFEVDKQVQIGTAPDDKIISCCLQAGETYEYVFLLSNDINLKNKAMIHGLTVCTANDIVFKMLGKLNKADRVKGVMNKMGMLCSFIIVECMKDCYGNVWNQMDMMTSEQPWQFQKCLRIFKRYWATVFKDKLLKQFLKCVDDTLTFLNKNYHICDDSNEYYDLRKKCVELCIFLKDFEQYKDKVNKTIREISNIC